MHRHRTSRSFGTTLAATVLLALAACGSGSGGGGATEAPSRSVSPAPSQSDKPSPQERSPDPSTVEPVAVGQRVLSLSLGATHWAVDKHMFGVIAGYVGQPSTIKTYDVAGTEQASSATSDASTPCKLALTTRNDGVEVLLTVTEKTTAAQGINAGGTSRKLVAFDAATLTPLWTLPLQTQADSPDDYCSPGGTTGNDLTSRVQFTSDGAWALITLFTDEPLVVALKTGTAHAVRGVTQVAGQYLIAPRGDSGFETSIDVIDPASQSVVGSTTSLSVRRSLNNMVGVASDPPQLVVGSPQSGNDGTGITQGLSLPALKELWQLPTPPYGEMLIFDDETTHTAVLTEASGGPTTGLSQVTGKKVWTVPSDRLCAVARGKVLVTANDQLAVLDAATGQQLSFDASTSECPAMLPGGYSINEDSAGVTISRVL